MNQTQTQPESSDQEDYGQELDHTEGLTNEGINSFVKKLFAWIILGVAAVLLVLTLVFAN